MDVKDDRMRNRSVFIRPGELLEYVAFFSQEYFIQFQRFTIVVQAGLVRVVSPVDRIDDTDYAAVDSFKLESEEDEFQFIEAGSIFGAIRYLVDFGIDSEEFLIVEIYECFRPRETLFYFFSLQTKCDAMNTNIGPEISSSVVIIAKKNVCGQLDKIIEK